MPNDLAKGEVARATMYMNTRYEYSVTLNFYSVALMLEWHLKNPVTNREIYRNNTVHSLQGNRNPYIDRQDWACYIYGNTNSATQSICAATSVEPTSVEVTPSSASLNLGSSLTLSANVLLSCAPSGVTWSSANSSIATVSVGVTTIRATSTTSSAIYGSSTITVTNTSVPVSSVSISPTSLNLEVGSSASLTANVLPSNATNKYVSWSSSQPSFASVKSNGIVTALSPGSGTISVTTSDNGYTSSIPFTITQASVSEKPNTYSFGTSGNASWSNISGFAKYFTNSYGIETASVGGTLKSSNILENMPLGSLFTVTVVGRNE